MAATGSISVSGPWDRKRTNWLAREMIDGFSAVGSLTADLMLPFPTASDYEEQWVRVDLPDFYRIDSVIVSQEREYFLYASKFETLPTALQFPGRNLEPLYWA